MVYQRAVSTVSNCAGVLKSGVNFVLCNLGFDMRVGFLIERMALGCGLVITMGYCHATPCKQFKVKPQ